MSKHLFFFLAFCVFAGCKKDAPSPDPKDPDTSSLVMKMDGRDLSLDEKAIQALYYADEGEVTGALEISGQLPEDERIVFFLDEAKAQTINLSQHFPAVIGLSFNGANPLLDSGAGDAGRAPDKLATTKITATTQGTFTVPVYVKYVTQTNQLFAVSGSITVKLDGDDLTFDWDITFKDADGRTFPSKGSATIKDYKANLKPRAQINNPGANLSITEIAPDYGKAGTEVTLKGTGFSALKEENTVKLGDVSLEVISASATELKVTVPEDGTHGHFSVSVLGATAESIAIFHYEPIVESTDKESAKVGDEVTVTGEHFDADPQLLEVKVGEHVMEITSATLTEIKFKVAADTESGRITVARKGKDPVEGPELEITTTAPATGIPIEELFEIVEGNLTIEEILPNNNEYGAVWSMQIDETNHTLYAVTVDNLISINLSNKSVTHILGPTHAIMKNDLVAQNNPAGILQAIYPTGDGYLYGARNIFAAVLSANNVFKLDLQSKAHSFLGSAKVYNGASGQAIFFTSDKKFYIPEFGSFSVSGSTYGLASYDENMKNRNSMADKIFPSAANFKQLIPTGANSFRAVGIHSGKRSYRDVTNGNIGEETDWNEALAPLLPGTLVGMDHSNGNFYALFNEAVTDGEKRQANYTIGTATGNGIFVKKGVFTIKKSFEYGGDIYYLNSLYNNFNIFAADKNGSIYILIQTPIDGQYNEVLPGAGGIYRISF